MPAEHPAAVTSVARSATRRAVPVAEDRTAATKHLSLGRKLRYCLRCARNNEPWWEWSWGRWKWSAGAIFGLGLCLVIRHDEINVMLGPFAVGGFRG